MNLEQIMNWFMSCINIENPTCLYCNSPCSLESQDQTGGKYINHKHTCSVCSEYYTIFFETNHYYDIDRYYYNFNFSCKEFLVSMSNDPDSLSIRNRKAVSLRPGWVRVPPFHISFSDKDKLYEKLKTYLLFS